MDPVEKIDYEVRIRVDSLGDQIIGYAEEKRVISARADLSEADKAGQIEAAHSMLQQAMDIAFSREPGSICLGIRSIHDACEGPATEKERIRAAVELWQEELPALRRYLEYCAEMIEAHPHETTPELRQSQKCVTECSVVLEKICNRVKCELPKP